MYIIYMWSFTITVQSSFILLDAFRKMNLIFRYIISVQVYKSSYIFIFPLNILRVKLKSVSAFFLLFVIFKLHDLIIAKMYFANFKEAIKIRLTSLTIYLLE